MRRLLLTVLIPPFAACRFGCAGCCAAPIGVFWLAGLVSLGYAVLGGPLNLMGLSWGTAGLGAALWAISAAWAAFTIAGTDADKCEKPANTLCRRILPRMDESDPMDEVRKAR